MLLYDLSIKFWCHADPLGILHVCPTSVVRSAELCVL